jgi:hypothetical protein
MRVASGIQQEFVKIKESREFDRDAMLLGTCYSLVAAHLVLCAQPESSPTSVAARHFLISSLSLLVIISALLAFVQEASADLLPSQEGSP